MWRWGPGAPLRAALLAALAVAAAAWDGPERCETEMNNIKDLLQVSCVAKGLAGVPPKLPKDTGILLLSANHLLRVSTASLQHLARLSELDLSNNSLAALETQGAELPHLQQLLLAHNRLCSLPALRGLPRLRRLALGHNCLAQLPEGGFRALGQLQDLELQGNRLRGLPPGAFAGLAELKDVDLADNLLESLPRGLLAGLGKVEILRLERNRLRSLPDGFFPEENLFAYVYLAGNPWACDCRLVYLRDWVAGNEISVYTRTFVREGGLRKEVTENNPESVTCHTPASRRGEPVMHFEAACGGAEPPGATHPALATPAPSTPAPPPVPTTLGPPSTPQAVPTTPGPPSTRQAVPTTSGPPSTPQAVPTAPGPPSTTLPAVSLAPSAAGATRVTQTRPSARPPTPPGTTGPATDTPTGAADTPRAAMTAATAPPPLSTGAHPLSTPPASPRPPCFLPPAPTTHCRCPGLPPPALPLPRPLQSVGARGGRPASRCCPIRLALYLACLALAGLGMLAGLGVLAWGPLRRAPPVPRGPPGAPLARQRQPPCDRGPGPRMFRVCRRFPVAPLRHVSWLLVSLAGPAKPLAVGRGASSYSLDRGRDAIGAVRTTCARASL